MKRLLVGDLREELLSTLEVILKHWGYRVVLSSRPEQLTEFLQETSPDLLIMGSRLLTDQASPLFQAVESRLTDGTTPLIILRDREVEDSLTAPHEVLEVPVDIFALFAQIQKYIEQHPRKNLRLTVKLPGMFCSGDRCQFAEVLSLSTQGLFIKTGVPLALGDRLSMIIPLMGMKQELELETRVLYRVDPGPENNYLQGAGIEFIPMGEEAGKALKRFIEYCFLGELSASQRGAEGLDPAHLYNIAPELTLRLSKTIDGSSPPLSVNSPKQARSS
jgi:Tfp pilus assembly protein PilZ